MKYVASFCVLVLVATVVTSRTVFEESDNTDLGMIHYETGVLSWFSPLKDTTKKKIEQFRFFRLWLDQSCYWLLFRLCFLVFTSTEDYCDADSDSDSVPNSNANESYNFSALPQFVLQKPNNHDQSCCALPSCWRNVAKLLLNDEFFQWMNLYKKKHRLRRIFLLK